MRVVFDTNVVVSALVFGGRLGWLRALWAREAVIPIVCRETVVELLRVLSYPKFRLDTAMRNVLLQDYLPFAKTVLLPADAPDLPVACRDRDDLVFIALAMISGAECLVTGGGDLAVLRSSSPVPILLVGELHARFASVRH